MKFVGRAKKLEQLHTQLQQNERIAITAIAGMGGIGKTELALQYALNQLQQGQYSAGCCWLRARDREIATDIVTFAQVHLGLSLPEQLEIEDQVRFCWQRWPEGEALVVLDDMTDYQAIEPYLPPADPRFKLLITTRLDLGSTMQKVPLEELDEDGSIALLESLVGVERVRSQLVDAQALCKWVGYLPLALELLGRFLARKLDWSIGRLLKALDEKRLAAKALVETENGMTGQLGVAAALELSWQELNEAEQELACVLGMFAITPIPWSLVEGCQPEVDPDDLENFRDNGLMAHSLLKRVGDGSYQLHQIVQEYFRIKLGEMVIGEASQNQGQVIKDAFCQTMTEIAETIEHAPTFKQIERVCESIPHLEEGVQSWIDNVNNKNLIWLFVGIGNFYEGQGDYSFAEYWWGKCLEETQKRFGKEHQDVATSQCKLGVLLESQGNYQRAELFYQSALQIRKNLLGENHLDIATSMSDLAVLYKLQGRYEDAEPLHKSALEMYKHLLSDEHESIASSQNNLAELYCSQERYEEAKLLYRSALKISQCLFGQDHVSVIIIRNNIALLYYYQGEYGKAELLYLLVLEMCGRLLKQEHLFVAKIRNNLALLYHSQEKHEESEFFYQSALKTHERLLGNEHPDTATIQWNLGIFYQNQSRYLEAKVLYCQALKIAQCKLPKAHPWIQVILNSLNSLPQSPA